MRPSIIVVGLGPAGPDLVSAGVRSLLEADGTKRFLRTSQCDAASVFDWDGTFDSVYESADTLEDVYVQIASRLEDLAKEFGQIIYAVPGSANVAEASVGHLRHLADVDLVVLPGLSFLDLCWLALDVDPISDGVKLVDGHRFSQQAVGHPGPLLVSQVDRDSVLESIALGFDVAPRRVVVLQALGHPNQRIQEVDFADLGSLSSSLDHLTSVYLDGIVAPVGSAFAAFESLVDDLRVGCPWDKKQDHRSLIRHLIEEAYEVAEAIDSLPPGAGAFSDPGSSSLSPRGGYELVDSSEIDRYADLEEELGDLLFQVGFHSRLAREAGHFGLADVARAVTQKLVSRHPHVFGDVVAETSDQVLRNWEKIKAAEKPERVGLLDGVPKSLPSLLMAAKVQKKAAAVGFDWPDEGPVWAKLLEEVDELRVDRNLDELGDLLFAVVNLARHLGLDPELALRGACEKFAARFAVVEQLASRPLSEMSLTELDDLWLIAKQSQARP